MAGDSMHSDSTYGELTRMTAAELAAAIAAGETSAVDVTRAHLDRIEAVDQRVHAFLHVAPEAALSAAAAVDERRGAGEPLGPLAGVPLALKDVFTTTDMPTTCGSRILEGWRPPYDATVTRRLRQAGVVILGKANMDEFAMGSSTENSAFGPSHNPWDLSRVPGGSSGGSSAAVTAFEAPLGIGTDTGGASRPPPPPPRPGGGAGAHGARRGTAARGHVGTRPVRLDLYRRAGSPGRGRGTAGGRERAARRRGDRAQRRGLPAGGAGQVRRGGGAAGVAGGQDHRGVLPALQLRAARVLPDRAQRVLVQPGPLRRHAVRPAGR